MFLLLCLAATAAAMPAIQETPILPTGIWRYAYEPMLKTNVLYDPYQQFIEDANANMVYLSAIPEPLALRSLNPAVLEAADRTRERELTEENKEPLSPETVKTEEPAKKEVPAMEEVGEPNEAMALEHTEYLAPEYTIKEREHIPEEASKDEEPEIFNEPEPEHITHEALTSVEPIPSPPIENVVIEPEKSKFPFVSSLLPWLANLKPSKLPISIPSLSHLNFPSWPSLNLHFLPIFNRSGGPGISEQSGRLIPMRSLYFPYSTYPEYSPFKVVRDDKQKTVWN